MRTITAPELHAEMRAQGVSSHEDIAFVCPACGTVQSTRYFTAADFESEGITDWQGWLNRICETAIRQAVAA